MWHAFLVPHENDHQSCVNHYSLVTHWHVRQTTRVLCIYLDFTERYELGVVDSENNFDFRIFRLHLWWVMRSPHWEPQMNATKVNKCTFLHSDEMHSPIILIIFIRHHVHDFAIHQTDGNKSTSKSFDWMFRKISILNIAIKKNWLVATNDINLQSDSRFRSSINTIIAIYHFKWARKRARNEPIQFLYKLNHFLDFDICKTCCEIGGASINWWLTVQCVCVCMWCNLTNRTHTMIGICWYENPLFYCIYLNRNSKYG